MFVTDDKIPIPVARYYVHSNIELRIPSDGGGGGGGGGEGGGEKGWNGREGEFVIPADRPVPIDCARKMLESCLLECHANSC